MSPFRFSCSCSCSCSFSFFCAHAQTRTRIAHAHAHTRTRAHHIQVGEAREVELLLIKRLAIIRALANVVSQVTPSFVALASILCYTAVAGETLVAHRIFTALSLFDTLKDPLTR